MQRARRWLVLALLTLTGSVAAQAQDRVRLHNAGPGREGVLVDGRLGNGVPINDKTYLSLDVGSFFDGLFPSVILDDIIASTTSNELIAYSRGRPPLLKQDVQWSPGSNTIDVEFFDEYRIPIHVWILHGNFEHERSRAVEHSIETSRILWEERVGVGFSQLEIRNATQDPSAASLLTVDCADADALARQIGYVSGAVNAYYVNQVIQDGVPTRFGAWWCGGIPFILMGSGTSGVVFAHEVGHALSLGHTDFAPTQFNISNVMWPSVNQGQTNYLTEGQAFRCIYHPWSVLSWLYGVKRDTASRFCENNVAVGDPGCLPLWKRIWQDGGFHAN